MLDCSARSWPPVFAVSGAPNVWACGWATWLSAEQAKNLLGCPNGEALIGKRDRAFSRCYSGAGCGVLKPLNSHWSIFSAGTITGPSSICSANVATFDPCPFRTGSRVSSIAGLPRLTTEQYLGCKQRFRSAVNHHIGIAPDEE